MGRRGCNGSSNRDYPRPVEVPEEEDDPGTELTIEGRCTSLNSLSDFVSGLEASELFERPVEIIDSRVEPASASMPELIRFSVKARQRAKAAD